MEQGTKSKNTLKLKVITMDRVVFNNDIQSVVAPGELGYFGILSGHTPMINCLKQGNCKIKESADKEVSINISGGFLFVNNNDITILADNVIE